MFDWAGVDLLGFDSSSTDTTIRQRLIASIYLLGDIYSRDLHVYYLKADGRATKTPKNESTNLDLH